MLVYDENPPRFTGRMNFDNANATKKYLEHYSNRLYLQFMLRAGTFEEKQQAHRELVICDRKLEYWRRHQNFDKDAANAGATKLLNDWRS